MEVKWLEDFISLAETRSFRLSAELRHVSQPAFSRRIQSLEAWLGVDLIDRTSHPTCLTPAGQTFYERAIDMLGQINNTRALLKNGCSSEQATIDFAVPHTLGLAYLPEWMAKLRAKCGVLHSRLMALNVGEAVMAMADGGCDLLLCYHHHSKPVQLPANRYDMLKLGTETIRAYARCDKKGGPELCLPGSADAPLPFLSYSGNAYLGQMVDLISADARHPLHLEKRYETDMAEGLKTMALEGHGIAFLPESTVVREVKEKRLARADGGRADWEVCMEVRLYRERPTPQRPGKPIVSKLWSNLQGLGSDQPEALGSGNVGSECRIVFPRAGVSEESQALVNAIRRNGISVGQRLLSETI